MITGYNVWQWFNDEWDLVGSLLASQDPEYRYIAVTVHDSSDTSTNWTTFRISAHGVDPSDVYYSAPDSGYSVDNVEPETPQGIAGFYGYASPLGLTIWWHPNPDEDLLEYHVHRGIGPDFIPSEETMIASTVTPL